jgi:hypothetical protein
LAGFGDWPGKMMHLLSIVRDLAKWFGFRRLQSMAPKSAASGGGSRFQNHPGVRSVYCIISPTGQIAGNGSIHHWAVANIKRIWGDNGDDRRVFTGRELPEVQITDKGIPVALDRPPDFGRQIRLFGGAIQ